MMKEAVVKKTKAVELPKVIKDYQRSYLIQNMTNMRYGILDNNYKTLHQPWYCKDYYNEFVTTQIDGNSRTIYGYKSEKLNFNLLEQETFKLGLFLNIGGKEDIRKYANNILSLLNVADNNRGFIPTTVEFTDGTRTIVLNVDMRWLSTNPVYLSFYLLIVRMAYNYIEGRSFNDFIITDFKDAKPKINTNEFYSYNGYGAILNYLYEGGNLDITWNDYINHPTSTLHNGSGVVSYYRNNKEKVNKLIEEFKNEVKI